MPLHEMTPEDGFVFAATGAAYVALARRTARNLRAVMPGAQIDLFADRPLEDPVFDRVHPLAHTGKRPKMEALRESRFARTVYLDCDVVAVAEVSDLFAMLARFDVVGAHEMYGASPMATADPGGIPVAYRQINSGVLGIAKSGATAALLRTWEAEVAARDIQWDQPVLRRLLWESDLRVGILPPDYNLMHTRFIRASGRRMSAPRLLHITALHEEGAGGDPETPIDIAATLGSETAAALDALLAGDVTLGGTASLADRVSARLRSHPAAHRTVRRWWKRIRR